MRCATVTGIGPLPTISHTSPGRVAPRISAEWSIRTTVVTARTTGAPSPIPPAHRPSATIASNASASDRSQRPSARASSNSSRSKGSILRHDARGAVDRTTDVDATGAVSVGPAPERSRRADPVVARVLVDTCRGLHPRALVAQPAHTVVLRAFQQVETPPRDRPTPRRRWPRPARPTAHRHATRPRSPAGRCRRGGLHRRPRRAHRGARRLRQPAGGVAVRAVVLPRSGRDHLAHRQGLARRTQPLDLGEQLDHRAARRHRRTDRVRTRRRAAAAAPPCGAGLRTSHSPGAIVNRGSRGSSRHSNEQVFVSRGKSSTRADPGGHVATRRGRVGREGDTDGTGARRGLPPRSGNEVSSASCTRRTSSCASGTVRATNSASSSCSPNPMSTVARPVSARTPFTVWMTFVGSARTSTRALAPSFPTTDQVRRRPATSSMRSRGDE